MMSPKGWLKDEGLLASRADGLAPRLHVRDCFPWQLTPILHRLGLYDEVLRSTTRRYLTSVLLLPAP